MSNPKVSIVIPSYNQGKYLEDTILSVVNQTYKNIEIIIIDGGSTDNSVDIIKKYEDKIHFWVSEKDKGQANAINKGFKKASGEIFAWLNSDDLYTKNAVELIVNEFNKDPSVSIVYGDYYLLYPSGETKLKKKISFNYNICLYSYLMIPQPSCFFRREAFEAVGGLDETFNYCLDYDLFLRMAKNRKVKHIQIPLSYFRLHDESKSVSKKGNFKYENARVREKILGRPFNKLDKFKQKYYLLRAVIAFYVERGEIVYKKEKGKA